MLYLHTEQVQALKLTAPRGTSAALYLEFLLLITQYLNFSTIYCQASGPGPGQCSSLK